MPQLIGLKERQLGLAEIETKLKTLASVRDFLEKENPAGVYTLSFDKQRIKLHCPDRGPINALVEAYKKSLVAEIRELADKNAVEFNEEDEALLG